MKKFFKGLGLAIFTTTLFLATLALFLLLPVRQVIEKNSIKDMISNIEIEKVILENPQFKKAVDNVLEPIYNETRKLGIDDEVIIKIVDSKEVKNFVGDITGNIVESLFTGVNNKLISVGGATQLVSDTMDEISKTGYYVFKPEEKEAVLKVVEDKVEEYEEYIPDTSIFEDVMDRQEQDAFESIRFLFGNQIIMYLSIVIVISILCIIALKWSKLKWIEWTAIPLLLSSFIVTILTVILLFAGKAMTKNIPYIFTILEKGIHFSFVLNSVVILSMIVLLIVYKVVEKKYFVEIEKK